MRQSVKKKDKYPEAKHQMTARVVSVNGRFASSSSAALGLIPRFLIANSRNRRRRCRAEGVPHQIAGSMEQRRRAKSHGCQGVGTLRTTATRGWRSEAFLVTSVPEDLREEGGRVPVAVAIVVAERVGVVIVEDSLAGVRVGEEGTDEARL